MFFFFDSDNYQVSDMIDRMKSIKPLKEIIEQTGISQPVISQWKTRNTFPKCDDLYRIACCLNVSMEWLLTGEIKQNQQPDLSDKELELINNYRSLQAHDKSMLQIMISAMASNQN